MLRIANRFPHLAGMALLVGSYSICAAPSHNANHPTPLGSGVNKGNVDNMENGPNYYYFLAGPGHVEMHYAFHEMGLFGNPLKQVLNFDLLDEKDKLISHGAIQSMGRLERLTQRGDLSSPTKLVIRVNSPSAAIRLGGYYEIEAIGAVRFDGKTTGEDTHPLDTRLTHPGGALTGPPTSLTGPPVALTSGAPTSLYDLVGALTSVQQSPKELRLTLAADILFDFGKATIRSDAKAALDRVTEIIRANSRGQVKIEGFTDSKGAASYNLQLSNARAQAVETWLIDREGLSREAFSARGFGATRFAAPNSKQDGSDDAVGRQKNRRVEIVVQRKT